MLIAFTSFIEWLNRSVAWLGECVGQGRTIMKSTALLNINFRQLVFQPSSRLPILPFRLPDGHSSG